MYVAMAVIMADAMMRCVGINRRDQASGGLREARRHDASIQAITNHQHMTQTGRATHMDHRSVAAAAAGGAIAIGPTPAPHRRIGAGGPGSADDDDDDQQRRRRRPIVVRSVAVPTTLSKKQQNILRVGTKPTPWSGAAEFDSVGRGLLLAAALFPPRSSVDDTSCDDATACTSSSSSAAYRCCPLGPDERAELDFAIRTVAVWRDRAEGGRLPHSVEISAALASALLQDATAHDLDDAAAAAYCGYGYHGRPPSASELSLRMAYSSTVVRATNGLADASVINRGLKKPGYGVSVAALCERIGIPGWVVDMRHDAAHNELPSLPSLRLASKTLLGYLGDKYWSELAQLRGEAAAKAVSILDEYKASAKAAAVEHATKINQQIAKAEAARSQVAKNRERRQQERAVKKKQKVEEGSDGEDDDDDFMDFGRFSIFADMDSSKEKGKKRPREESSAGSDDAAPTSMKQDAKNDESVKDQLLVADNKDAADETKSKAAKNKKKKKLASPLHFANQFINEVPIDTGLQILLSYLVWGGIGDMSPEKGALVPGSPATILETEQGFDKVKNRYILLLAKVSTAYTGFLQALMVNLVDLILLIKERQTGNTEATADAGDERKLFFLNRWVTYLVSREFHSHFDPHLGVFPRGKVDLTRKRVWKWSGTEKAFMADCAPSEAIHRWQFPLNSLYERCNSSPCGVELTLLLKKAGGDHILDQETKIDCSTKSQTDVDQKERGSKQSLQPTQETQEKSPPSSQLKGGTSGMSLEQMEALVSGSDAEDDRGDEIKPTGATRAFDVVHGSTVLKEPAKNETIAWTLCKSWDPCAIGTLPEYPSFY